MNSKRYLNRLIKNSSGFTLIELMVVIAIIGLLASMVLVVLQSARVKATASKYASEVKELKKAILLYRNDHNGDVILCPYAFGDCNDGAAYGAGNLNTALSPLVTAGYIAKVPHWPGAGSLPTWVYMFYFPSPSINYAQATDYSCNQNVDPTKWQLKTYKGIIDIVAPGNITMPFPDGYESCTAGASNICTWNNPPAGFHYYCLSLEYD